MSFPCTRCGLCCQNISGIADLNDYDRGDGVCLHYEADTGCQIYQQRPMACRIDEGFEHYAAGYISKTMYLKSNAEICNKLQDEAGIGREFRVKL